VEAQAGHAAQLQAGTGQLVVRGWAAVTGNEIVNKRGERVRVPRKHDERLFFYAGQSPAPPSLTPDARDRDRLEQDWRAVIESIDRTPSFNTSLHTGRLAYAVISAGSRGGFRVESLQPVMISRRRYRSSPMELIKPLRLDPATTLGELSSAERLFGWAALSRTADDAHGAVRGRLRVGPVVSSPACPITTHDPPLLLTTLNAPKPQNDRFYAASDKHGTPLVAEAERGTGFAPGGGLRGRKVYPHQGALSEEHRGIGERVKSNASVREWIAEKSQFTFELTLDDVEVVAAGALLWLLSLGEDHHVKLGGGRPLGFGSVSLKCDQIELSDGDGIRAGIRALARPEPLDATRRGELVAAFREAVKESYGRDFTEVPFIAAFLAASTGNVGSQVAELPTHYPRITPHADPEHPMYEWFAENEHPGRGGKQPLPPLGRDHGLRRDGR
jgi:CRISPR-associated protein (TIGR03986 family)